MYDYLVVGSGLFGATFAQKMKEAGRRCLIIDRRSHVAGNCHTEIKDGVPVHAYGPHLFHSNSEQVWNYVNRFAEFNSYRHRVKANYQGKIISLPFNMNTFHDLWGVTTPAEAREKIQSQLVQSTKSDLESWALNQVGTDIYRTLIEGYTQKHWQRHPSQLPSSIIRRLPLRYTYDDEYFHDRYQGVPVKGYTHMVENMIDGIDLRLGECFFDLPNWRAFAKKLVYSGRLDDLFQSKYGHLEYLTLNFQEQTGPSQGIGQMNYTHAAVPWTRITEHQVFIGCENATAIQTVEYPVAWSGGAVPYYPVVDSKNNHLKDLYWKEAAGQTDIIVGGRLGRHQYSDMGPVIASALSAADRELGRKTF